MNKRCEYSRRIIPFLLICLAIGSGTVRARPVIRLREPVAVRVPGRALSAAFTPQGALFAISVRGRDSIITLYDLSRGSGGPVKAVRRRRLLLAGAPVAVAILPERSRAA